MSKTEIPRSKLITMHALLCAIVLFFIITPKIAGVSLAFMPIIAVVISTELMGLKQGIITGFFFGMVSFIFHFIAPSILSPMFWNPLVSVLPRIFIAVGVYFGMKIGRILFKTSIEKGNKNHIMPYAFGAFAGVLTNTILVLGSMVLYYHGKTFSLNDKSTMISFQYVMVIAATNFPLEAILTTIIAPPITYVLSKQFKL